MTHQCVLAIGVFDLFHVGHLRYLQYARKEGRHLTVAVCSDAISLSIKGKMPIINETQRMEIIRGLGWVDEVRLQPTSTEMTEVAADWIAEWGIDHVVVGGGWEGSPRWSRLRPMLAARGISALFAPQTDGISTTQIVASIQNALIDI